MVGELEHLLELAPVLLRPPRIVVEVLLAPGVVEAGRLDVPLRVGADPDFPPRRRDRELPDALERGLVGQPVPRLVLVAKAPPVLDAANPRAGAVDPP